MPLMWGQVQEPHFTGDKIKALLQVSCFLNHLEVISGLQPFLGLERLIFVGEKGCFATFPPPPPWKGICRDDCFFIVTDVGWLRPVSDG